MTRWTIEQEQAIYDRNSNLLVAAAAGSGKTAVLIERIAQLVIQDQQDLSRFLIVTFTNAAAAEMRERLMITLLEAMEQNPEKEDQLRKQLYALNHASISTIHSFCLEVVRQYFYMVDIDPNFRIADEIEARMLRQETLEEVLEQAYMKEDPHFIGAVERFASGATDVEIAEMALRLYLFAQSQPDPEKWLASVAASYHITAEEFRHSQWVQSLRADAMMQLQGTIELIKQAMAFARLPDGPYEYLETLEHDITQLEVLQRILEQDFFAFCSTLQGFSFARLKTIREPANEELKEYARELRDQGKDIIYSLRKQIGSWEADRCYQQLRSMAPYLGALIDLCQQFSQAYQEKKREQGMLDFNDLEHYALYILADEDVAAAFRQQFHFIFVDEYQDSNLVQETILNSISRDNNRFMVGDVKQSIYRFRQADPGLFLEKYSSFQGDENALDRRIDLNRNFRSRPEILAGVNYIFRHIMSRELGELDYDEAAFLYPGLEAQEVDYEGMELVLLHTENQADEDGFAEETAASLEEYTNVQLEALYVAQRIKALLGTRIYDSKRGEFRTVEYRDMVVLMRATRNQAPYYVEEFMAQGIPVFADTGSGYFETAELSVFINLLHLIDNRRQDVPLLSVMRSTLYAFTEEELLEIRLYQANKPFYKAAAAYAEDKEDLIAEKIQQLNGDLDRWQEKATYLSMEEFIWLVMQDTGYDIFVSAMPGGEQRQANMRILLDKARQFEQSSMKGLFHFLRYVEQVQARQEDVGMARVLGENDNVVRIMSIHKSKGLEFPIVFAVGMGRAFNRTDLNAPLLMHKKLGLGSYYYDLASRAKTPTLPRLAIRQKNKMEALAEEMRILYVACTRAREQLILLGSSSRLSSALKRWSKPVDPYILTQAGSYLDWIIPVLLRHEDGQPLRDLFYQGMQTDHYPADGSRWEIKIIAAEQLLKNQQEQLQAVKLEQQHLLSFQQEEPGPDHEQITRALDWSYPWQELTHWPAKLSVTELNQLQQQGQMEQSLLPEINKKPAFLQSTHGLSSMELGSALHLVMQHVDFSLASREELQTLLASMVARELLSEEVAQNLDLGKVMAFLNSPLCNRIRKAKRVFREQPFNLLLNVNELQEEVLDESSILVQGMIDLYFEEEDGLVLVDYKSDRVKQSGILLERYAGQLELYGRALQEITGQMVKEAYLYSFALQEAIPLW